MVCSKCGQELKDGVKFCTKCGAKFGVEMKNNNRILIYLSTIFLVIGIIGFLVFIFSRGFFIMSAIGRLSIRASIIVAIIAQYRQKSKFALIVGIIACVLAIVM